MSSNILARSSTGSGVCSSDITPSGCERLNLRQEHRADRRRFRQLLGRAFVEALVGRGLAVLLESNQHLLLLRIPADFGDHVGENGFHPASVSHAPSPVLGLE